MYGKIKEHLQSELQTIEENGIFKSERIDNIQDYPNAKNLLNIFKVPHD